MLDCLVIGGGPGGLTTALYLARFKRSCLVVDAGASRLRLIANTRNVLGFPEGIAGAELLARVRQHVARFDVTVADGRVDTLTPLASGGFEAGLRHASQLATALGAPAQEDGQLVVDEHMRTNVPGLYAVGDVAAGLNQISVAAGQAAIAATDIHNSL